MDLQPKTVIRLIFVSHFLANSMIAASLWVPFYIDTLGWSLEIMLQVQMVFQIFLISMEVPSGYLADKFGRNRMVGLAAFVLSIASLSYSQATTIGTVLFSEFLFAIAISLISGSGEALLVDTMYRFGYTEEQRQKELSLYNSFIGMAYGASAPIGSLLVQFFTLRQIIALGAIPYFLGSLFTAAIGKTQKEKPNNELLFRNFFNSVKKIIVENKRKPKLLVSALDMIILWGFLPTFYISNVMYLRALAVPLQFWGFYVLFSNVIPFFVVKKLNSKTEGLNRKNFNFGLTMTAGMIFMSFYYSTPIVLALLYVVFTVLTNFKFGLLSTEINNDLDPATRSTAISMINMCSGISRIIFYATFGVLAERNLFQYSLAGLGILWGLGIILYFIRYAINKQKTAPQSAET